MSRVRTQPNRVNQLDEFPGHEVHDSDEVKCPDCGGELLLCQAFATGESLIWCESCEVDVTEHVEAKLGYKSAVAFCAEHRHEIDRLARHIARRGDDRAAVRVIVECALLTAPILELQTDYEGRISFRTQRYAKQIVDEWRAANGTDSVLRRRAR